MPKQVLGRGLEALIPTKTKTQFSSSLSGGTFSKDGVFEVETDKIIPNPHQPRKTFKQELLRELADSIKEHGIIQPLVVSSRDGQYELISGERRLQASKLLGLEKVPTIIRSATEQQKLEVALVENLQRDNLNPIDEARAFAKLIDEFNLTQQGVANKVGKSREAVANSLRLLELPRVVGEAIEEGKITAGHARAILAFKDEKRQLELFRSILKHGLSVREAEGQKQGKKNERAMEKRSREGAYAQDVEARLRSLLGNKVNVKSASKSIRVTFEFFSKDELEDFTKRFVH